MNTGTTEKSKPTPEVIYVTPDQEEDIGMNEELNNVEEKHNFSYTEWIKGPHSVMMIFVILGVIAYLFYKGYLYTIPNVLLFVIHPYNTNNA